MLLLSGDVRYGDILIRSVGNHELSIENFKGIVNYEDTKLVLQGKSQIVIITGECLTILYYVEHMIKLKGIVRVIEFQS
jgi:sporulation protein YqfC